MSSPFADDAIVHAEGHVHRGRSAIRAWIADTNAKYARTVQVCIGS